MGLLGQSAYLAVARLIDKAASLAVVLVVSRRFNEEGLGEFNYFFALGSLFLPLIDMGFGMLLLQRWHDRDARARRVLMTQLLYLKMVLGLTALAGTLLADAIVRPAHANPAAVLATFLALYLDSFCDYIRRPAHAQGIVWIEAVFPLVSRAVQIGGVFLFLNRITSGFQIIYIYAASSAFELIFSLYGLRGCAPIRLAGQKLESWYGILVDGFPFALSSFFIMATMYFDVVLLGHYDPSLRTAGAYGAATRIVMVLNVLNGGICHALFPKLIAARARNDRAHAGWLINGTLRAFLILFGAISIGGMCVGEGLMHALYGDKFTQTGTVFRLLSPLILLSAFYSVMGQTLELLGQQRQVMHVYALTAIVNVAGNLALIPLYGMYGSVAATLVSTTLMCALLLGMLRRNPNIEFHLACSWRAVLFLLILTGLYVPLAWLNVWVALPLGGVTFIALLAPLRNFWFCGMGRISGENSAEPAGT